jgi:hypothetical protein
MKAGKIAEVKGSFENIPTNEYPKTYKTTSGETLSSTLVVGQVGQDLEGNRLISGEAGDEEVTEVKHIRIDSDTGKITQMSDAEIVTNYTEFISSPGEFVVVETLDDAFAFEMIADATETEIEATELDLQSFADSHPDASLWMSGFYNHPGNADNGMVYGDDVNNDADLGDVLENSDKNSLGVKMHFRAKQLKLMLTESGYVEVYESDFSSMEFAALLREEILPHTD